MWTSALPALKNEVIQFSFVGTTQKTPLFSVQRDRRPSSVFLLPTAHQSLPDIDMSPLEVELQPPGQTVELVSRIDLEGHVLLP